MSKMYKKIPFFILSFLLIVITTFSSFEAVYADDVEYTWAKKVGGTLGEVFKKSITDSSNNIYLIGLFYGTVDFDPGPGTTNLTAAGDTNSFIAKYDSAGNYLWVKTIIDANIYDVKLDSSNNIYMSGSFIGTVDFDPGAGTANLTSVGVNDIFIAKYDSAGNYLWVKSTQGGGTENRGIGLSLDSLGNIYTTGIFNGTVDFDPGVNVVNFTSNDEIDVFILKLDSNGDYVWVKRIDTPYLQNVNDIIVDINNNLYILGKFQAFADFDLGVGVQNLETFGYQEGGDESTEDVFILKLDSNGDYVWAKNIGGLFNNTITGSDINLDSSGNIYVAGYFSGTIDFDPGAGIVNLTSAGGNDIFISRLDSYGNHVWVKSMGGASDDAVKSINLDSSNNIYIIGYFGGTVDFDPGVGTTNLTSIGGRDSLYLNLIPLVAIYGQKVSEVRVMITANLLY